jgi:error-prone DNA polymerase
VPIGNAAMDDRTFIEWDKDDIDTLRMMKVDVLALGMLTCIRKAFDLIATYDRRWTLATVPQEDPAVYDMLCKGDSLGVFQVESRAQMNMLPRLKPRCFYDLVIEVAIVRPGPIQGDMVHPYLKRRANPQAVVYPSPHPWEGPPDELKNVLVKTLGVPLFQEQAMRIAIEAAKFTPEEANKLRRSMATFRNMGDIHKFRDKMVGSMIRRGYPTEFAERCFKQIEGFGTYGFPESHAASFAKLVYISSWIKKHHPAAFACALLNSQPMGFYAPAEIVRDAREHGVEVRPIDVGFSDHDNLLEWVDKPVLRLGFRQIQSFKEDWAKAVIKARRETKFNSIEVLAQVARLPKRALVLLADADCFRSLGIERRQALWTARRLPDDVPLPLFESARGREQPDERMQPLPSMPLSEHVVIDYQTTHLSLKGHPMQFLRGLFQAERVQTCVETAKAKDGARLRCAGVVLVRQRPGSAKGVVFMTLADETGIANVVVWPAVMEQFRKEVMGARLVLVEGRIQKSPENIVHLVAGRLIDRSHELQRLSENDFRSRPSHSDETKPALVKAASDRQGGRRHPRNVRILPASRDFH